MNNDNGMKAVIAQDSSVLEDLLPVTFKSKNNMMKSQFLGFMAAVTVYSEAGYKVIRAAFESIPISARFKSPIHTLMHENGTDKTPSVYYVTNVMCLDTTVSSAIMSLINAYLLKTSDISERISMRNYLLHEELDAAIARIKANETMMKDEDLAVQIQVFENAAARDLQVRTVLK